MTISRGFFGRHDPRAVDLPPGQHRTHGFPVLTAGPTQLVSTSEWAFTITPESGQLKRWKWDEMMALPSEEVTVDIHCVTRWTKLGTKWRGVALDTLFADIETNYEYAMVHSYGGYTTNLPLKTSLEARPGSLTSTREIRFTSSMAARPDCWCRISTSGSPRSG